MKNWAMEYLKEKEISKDTVNKILSNLRAYETFLSKFNLNLKLVNPKNLVEYTEYLVSKDRNNVLDFLNAILHYSYFSKRYDFIT